MEKSALVYIILTLLTVGLAALIRNREYARPCVRPGYGPGSYRPLNREQARNAVAEFGIYCLLAGVSLCRIAVGNDYWVYRENFKLIGQGRHVSSEIGFNLTVKGMIELFGYDRYLPIFGLFSLVTVWFFVRAIHDQAEDFAFSLFLLMTCGYYFNSLNTVRYYLALAIALYSMKYVLREEYGRFVFLILMGALFHKSILLTIPVYLTAAYLAKTKWKIWHGVVCGIFLVSLVFGQNFYRILIFKIYPFYEDTHFDEGRISYANLAKCLLVFVLYALVWVRTKPQWQQRFYLLLNVMGCGAFCCGGFVPEVTRIGYYMIVSQVFLIPQLLDRMQKGKLRTLCRIGTVAAFTLYFALLLKQMYLVDIRLLPYRNWIFD